MGWVESASGRLADPLALGRCKGLRSVRLGRLPEAPCVASRQSPARRRFQPLGRWLRQPRGQRLGGIGFRSLPNGCDATDRGSDCSLSAVGPLAWTIATIWGRPACSRHQRPPRPEQHCRVFGECLNLRASVQAMLAQPATYTLTFRAPPGSWCCLSSSIDIVAGSCSRPAYLMRTRTPSRHRV